MGELKHNLQAYSSGSQVCLDKSHLDECSVIANMQWQYSGGREGKNAEQGQYG